MLMRCPKCGSIDVHSSRGKGTKDSALRFVGIAPRRCSACGWRGYRPRFLYPSKQRAGPSGASAPVIDAAAEAAFERSMRRRRRLHSHSRRKRTRALKAILYALALGAGTGLAVYVFSGE